MALESLREQDWLHFRRRNGSRYVFFFPLCSFFIICSSLLPKHNELLVFFLPCLDSYLLSLVFHSTGKTIQIIGVLLVLFGKTGEPARDHAGVRQRRHRPEITGAAAAAAEAPLWTPPLDTVAAGANLENTALTPQPQPQQFPYPVMIVVPCTVIQNWTNELNKWGIFSIAYCNARDFDGTLDAARRGTVEVVLMSYE